MMNIRGLQQLVRQCLWVCAVVLAVLPLFSHAAGVLVLSSRAGGAYEDTIEGIRVELGKTLDLRIHYLSGPSPSWRAPDSTSLIIAVGVEAASAAIQGTEPGTAVLCVLIPRSAYETLAASNREGRRLSAIYLDNPATRQLELIRLLLPQARSVGTVLGNVSIRERDFLRAAARDRGLMLKADFAQRDSELYPALKSVLSESDVFLALPDPSVINASTAQNVLITAFRSQVPVVGYTASYVRAGALAAVYSTPQQIGQEAGQITKVYQRTSNLPAPKHPRYFSVGVNATLMRSMGMPAADEQALEQRLIRGE